MSQAEIHHVSDYIKCIENVVKGYDTHYKLLYRGEQRTDYLLLPSVYRKKKTDSITDPRTGVEEPIYNELYLHNASEAGILQAFMVDAASYVRNVSVDDRFSWVEYAQHFGVPTRLMDWSENPLVALFFACQSEENDGKVYMLRHSNYRKITAQYTSDLLQQKTIKQCAAEMIWEDKEGFPYPIVFQPYYLDQRMKAQSSCFMVWGNKPQPLNELVEELEKNGKAQSFYQEELTEGVKSLTAKTDTALEHLIIPAESKLRLLRELDTMNINQSSLFPGLDGIGRSVEWRFRLKKDPDEIF